MTELKRCPFCGSKNLSDYLNNDGITIIYCIDCFEANDGRSINVDSWNTRPIEDELNATIAQLTAEIERLKQEVVKEAAWNEALSDNNKLQFQYGEKLTAERDELREQLAAQETISEIQQMALQDKNSFAELQMRGKLSERITDLEMALDKAVETIGSVIACCTYGSNEEAKQGAYGISHQAFTKIDEFIKYLYNHADIDTQSAPMFLGELSIEKERRHYDQND